MSRKGPVTVPLQIWEHLPLIPGAEPSLCPRSTGNRMASIRQRVWAGPEAGVRGCVGHSGGQRNSAGSRGAGRPHLDLALAHDPVCALAVLLGDLRFVVTLFIAEYPQGLGAFQLNLKFLKSQERRKVPHCERKRSPVGSSLPQKDPCLKTLSTLVLQRRPSEATSL